MAHGHGHLVEGRSNPNNMVHVTCESCKVFLGHLGSGPTHHRRYHTRPDADDTGDEEGRVRFRPWSGPRPDRLAASVVQQLALCLPATSEPSRLLTVYSISALQHPQIV